MILAVESSNRLFCLARLLLTHSLIYSFNKFLFAISLSECGSLIFILFFIFDVHFVVLCCVAAAVFSFVLSVCVALTAAVNCAQFSFRNIFHCIVLYGIVLYH